MEWQFWKGTECDDICVFCNAWQIDSIAEETPQVGRLTQWITVISLQMYGFSVKDDLSTATAECPAYSQ